MKKIVIFLLTFVLAFWCFACAPVSPPDTDGPGTVTPGGEQEGSYRYAGTATVAPYQVYNADDTAVADASYDSMYLAIRYAGANATSKNALYIKDGNGLKIFERQALSNCWVYDGTHFVGTMEQKAAIAWADEHPRCYIVNGRGTAYVHLGAENHAAPHPEDVYERISGGFSYVFSSSGEMGAADTWEKYGYSYASGYVRLSEATYRDATELTPSSQWNAYIFFNIRGRDNCDLGIGAFAGGNGAWKIVHNCSNEDHKKPDAETPSFFVYQDQVVTTMTKDPETGIYSGADDLFIEAIGSTDTWILRVTNLRTNQVFGYTHTHKDMNKDAEGYFRVVLAASLCPVIGSIWDASAGGYLKNVVWEDVKLARWNSEGVYTDADKESMRIGTANVQHAFTQAADTAHLSWGEHKTDGTYKSGNSYKAGTPYYSFSSYYDGTHIED